MGVDGQNALQIVHALVRAFGQGRSPQPGLCVVRIFFLYRLKVSIGADGVPLAGGLHALFQKEPDLCFWIRLRYGRLHRSHPYG